MRATSLSRLFASFAREERGAAIVEYGVAIGLVLVIALATLTSMGENLALLFGGVESELAQEAPN